MCNRHGLMAILSPISFPDHVTSNHIRTACANALLTRRLEGHTWAPDPFAEDTAVGVLPPETPTIADLRTLIDANIHAADPNASVHVIEDYADRVSYWVLTSVCYIGVDAPPPGIQPVTYIELSTSRSVYTEHDALASVNLSYCSVSATHADILRTVGEGLLPFPEVEVERANEVYMMVRSMGELSLRRCDHPPTPLQPDCYTESALNAWAVVRAQALDPNPRGRLGLLSGPPGTGKTYLIRSLLGDLGDHTVIIVPAGLIDQVSGPDLMAVLLEQQRAGSPMILVCEDADRALAKRTKRGASVTALSELLNLTDGLMGTLLDIRIIATTNLPDIDLDPAVVRPGRMSAHVQTSPLCGDGLYALCARLGVMPPANTTELTIAEVFALCHPFST